jgi:hypothetical protein
LAETKNELSHAKQMQSSFDILQMLKSNTLNRRIEILIKSAILVGVFLMFTFCGSCGIAVAKEPLPNLTPPSGKIPTNYFGLHILHLIQDQDTNWPNITFGTWRLWDAHVSWNLLEPRKGQYDFSLLDQYIQVAQQKNVDLILTLAITPPWADNGVHGGTAPPADLGDWQAFVQTAAQRYAGKIHYYEIWNEPDHTAWFTGTVQDIVNLDAAAYTAIKDADPTATVLSPPVDGDPDGQAWLDSFLSLGGGKYVDLYAFHFYVGGYPELMVSKVQQVKDILAKYGEDKKLIWNTESGWPFYRMTAELGADYIARAYIVNWALGLHRMNIYAWDHPRLGIAPDGLDTQMTAAYSHIVHWLQNATMSRCLELENGVWLANVQLASGQMAKIAWYPDGTTLLDPAHVGAASEYEDMSGAIFPIAAGGQHVHVSRSPILLKYPTH